MLALLLPSSLRILRASYTRVQFLIIFELAEASILSSRETSVKLAVYIASPMQNFTMKVGSEIHVEIQNDSI